MSDQLIVQGLPTIDEIDLHRYLSRKHGGEAIESCIIIRDRDTKRSRGFGFLKFPDVESAGFFRDEWRDGGLELEGHRLRIDFTRDARAEGDSWTCDNTACRASNFARRDVCYKCDRPRPESDFTKDTSSLPSQFLQVRDLPIDTLPEHIVTSITKLPDVQIRRLLIVSGRHDDHVPIAFIEFEDSNAAGRALALAAALPGKGFSVKSKPVSLSFIHGGVFVPVYGMVEPGVFKATNSAQLLAYWNPEYLCSVYLPEGAIPEDETPDESKKRKDSAEHGKRKKTKALGSGVTTKSGSGGMISHWSKKQDELNGQIKDRMPADDTGHTSYADLNIMACLLCSRKFKSHEELQQHETQSDLHRTNLATPLLVSKAQERLRARKVQFPAVLTAPLPETAKHDTSEYRDRALERRNQIKQSGEVLERPTARRKRSAEEAKAATAAADEVVAVVRPDKGLRMMGKMGYTSGGLGREGQGREEAVRAEAYLPGAGLGSAGARLDEKTAEARRSGSSYADFVKGVKEQARSRYHQV